MEGTESGSTMLTRMRRSFAPSITALSSRLSGSAEKKVFITSMFQVEIAPGSQMAQ